MSSPISSASPNSIDSIDFKSVEQEMKTKSKQLILPGIKYVLVSQLNNFTGGKFKCLRNWQVSSGKALFQTINDAFSPILAETLKHKEALWKLAVAKGEETEESQEESEDCLQEEAKIQKGCK